MIIKPKKIVYGFDPDFIRRKKDDTWSYYFKIYPLFQTEDVEFYCADHIQMDWKVATIVINDPKARNGLNAIDIPLDDPIPSGLEPYRDLILQAKEIVNQIDWKNYEPINNYKREE